MQIRIRDPGWKKFGSGINIPDPQHWEAHALMKSPGFTVPAACLEKTRIYVFYSLFII